MQLLQDHCQGLNCSAKGGGSLFRGPLIILYSKPVKNISIGGLQGGPKISHYHESSLNRIKPHN